MTWRGETVRRDWESQGRDWKETLMSCWGRKTVRLRVRGGGGLGRRHWWVAGQERLWDWESQGGGGGGDWKETLMSCWGRDCVTERVRGDWKETLMSCWGEKDREWWLEGGETVRWDWESHGGGGGGWLEGDIDELLGKRLCDWESEGGLEGDIDELLGKKDCETERVRGGGGDWKETLMSCWGRKTVRLRVRGGTGRRHWWVAGEERPGVMTWRRRNC